MFDGKGRILGWAGIWGFEARVVGEIRYRGRGAWACVGLWTCGYM